MPNDIISISDSQSSTGSNDDALTITPPDPLSQRENAATTSQPLRNTNPGRSRQASSQGISTIPLSTPPPLAAAAPWRSHMLSVVNGIPLPSLPRPSMNTTPGVFVMPSLPTALPFNSNAVGSRPYRRSVGLNFVPLPPPPPYSGGMGRVSYSAALAHSPTYGRRERGSGSLINSLGINYTRPLERESGSYHHGANYPNHHHHHVGASYPNPHGANYHNPLGANFSHGFGSYERYHPYLRSGDHTLFLGRENVDQPSVQGRGNNLESSRREEDFLGFMRGNNNPAPRPRQVARENPTNEMLAEWGSTLSLGTGRGRNLDLNM